MLIVGFAQGEWPIMTLCVEPEEGWTLQDHHLDWPWLGWVLKNIPLALAFHYTWHIPHDFACNVEVVAWLFMQ